MPASPVRKGTPTPHTRKHNLLFWPVLTWRSALKLWYQLDMTTQHLSRFVDAQEHAYARALAEIRRGRKESHWMWFIFPQLRGLGTSEMATRYALASADEARAYLRHPVLGPRLLEIVGALQELHGVTAERVLGTVDAMKLRSSLTLFAAAAPETELFAAALQRWFGGVADERTLELLRRPR